MAKALRYVLDVDPDKGIAGLKKFEGASDTTTRKTSSGWSGMGGVMGAAVVGAIALGVKKIVEFGAESVQVYRQVEAASFGLRVAAGEHYAEMRSEAEKLSEATGNIIRVDEIEGAMTSSFKMLERLSLSTEQISTITARAADQALLKGRSLEDSSSALAAAIRGETEAAEAYGISINENYMKNIAFGGSLKNVWGKLTDLEKAQYRYNALMEQTSHTTGAAGAKIDTLDGQLKAMGNNWTDMKVSLGSSADDSSVIGSLGGVNDALKLFTATIENEKSSLVSLITLFGDAAAGALLLARNLSGFETKEEKYIRLKGRQAEMTQWLADLGKNKDALVRNFGLDTVIAQMQQVKEDLAWIKKVESEGKSSSSGTGAPDGAPGSGADGNVVDPNGEILRQKETFDKEYLKIIERTYAEEKTILAAQYEINKALYKKDAAGRLKVERWYADASKKLKKKHFSGRKKLIDDASLYLKKKEMGDFDFEVFMLEERSDALVAAGMDKLDALEWYHNQVEDLNEKAWDNERKIQREREKEFESFINTYGSMMADVLSITDETFTAISTLMKDIFKGDLGKGIQSSLEKVFGQIDFKALSETMASAGAGVEIGNAIAMGIGGNRELQNAGGIAGGAAMGFMAGGGPWGAAIGAGVGALSGNYGPGAPSGAFGEFGAGQAKGIQGDPAGALAKGLNLVNASLDRMNPDVLIRTLRQVQNISRNVLDLDSLIADQGLAEKFNELFSSLDSGASISRDGVEGLSNIIETFGINSEIALGAMTEVGGVAADFALSAAAGGDASSLFAQGAVDLAVALNREGAELKNNIAAYDGMISKIAAVDERTRGLTNATAAQSLADNILAQAQLFSTEQIQSAAGASERLGQIQERQAIITEQLANAHHLSADQIAVLTGEMAGLSSEAEGIERNLTGMSDATGSVGDGTEVAGTNAEVATGKMAGFGDSAEIAGGQATIAAGKIGGLGAAIGGLHDKTITVGVHYADSTPPPPGAEASSGENGRTLRKHHTGRLGGPQELAVLRVDEDVVPPESRFDYAMRVLADRQTVPRASAVSPGSTITLSQIIHAPPGMNTEELAELSSARAVEKLRDLSAQGVLVIHERGVGSDFR